MQSPSNSQTKAIKHGKGPMLVLAGPGSGKTFVMIQRVLNLIHEKQIRPEQILVISFSKASTLELKQRFQKQSKEIFKSKALKEIKENNNLRSNLTDKSGNEVNCATFHACFFHILKETYHYTSKDIITEKQKRDILKIILLDSDYSVSREEQRDIKYGNERKEKYHRFLVNNKIEQLKKLQQNESIRKEDGRNQDRLQSEKIKKNVESYKQVEIERRNDNHSEQIGIKGRDDNHSEQIEIERRNDNHSEQIEIERRNDNHSEQDEIKNIEEKTEEYLQKISFYKNKGMKELKEKESQQFQRIFHAYNDEMHRQRKLDFDDMGLLCLQLFQTRPEILEKWQERFQYVLIDEFQDINMIQFRIIQLLVKKYQNLFVVGDDDQAIYGFRGSNPQIMLDFEKYYPNTEKVLLETNYRCSKQIVREALKVIEQNKVRFQKEIRAVCSGKRENEDEQKTKENKRKEKEDAVIYQGFENCQREYSYIGEQIKKFTEEQRYNYSDIACIFRTNQDMIGLAEYFARNKIPFVMKEKCGSVFKHFIALDMTAYLQFFFEGRKRDDFIRIMNKPLRYISRNALSYVNSEVITWQVLKKYYSTKKYMIANIEQLEQNERWIQNLDLYGACFYIRKVIGYEEYLKQYIKEQNMDWEEAKEILDFVQESTRNMRNLEEWKEYIEQYEEVLKNSDEEKEGVQIITMHACKGLEYHVVFLPDCNEGKVPHRKAVSPEEIEEERRMFYVAMTRAKRHLEILYIEDKMKRNLQVSRFLTKLTPKSRLVWKQ